MMSGNAVDKLDIALVKSASVIPLAPQSKPVIKLAPPSLFHRWVNAAAIHPDPHCHVTCSGDSDQIRDFLLPRFVALMVIKVARVVTDLVDMRCDQLGEPIVFLQIDGEIGGRLPSNLRQGRRIGFAVHRNSHDVGPGLLKVVDQLQGRRHIASFRRGHALHGDRVGITNGYCADLYLSCGVPWLLHELFLWGVGGSPSNVMGKVIVPFGLRSRLCDPLGCRDALKVARPFPPIFSYGGAFGNATEERARN